MARTRKKAARASCREFGYTHGAARRRGAEYALSRTSSRISGAVGYDDLETDDAAHRYSSTMRNCLASSGAPASPRTPTGGRVARIEYGRRFDDEFIDAAIAYRIIAALEFFTPAANRSFTSSRARSVEAYGSGTRVSIPCDVAEYADLLRQGEESVAAMKLINAANQLLDAIQLALMRKRLALALSIPPMRVLLNGEYGRTRVFARRRLTPTAISVFARSRRYRLTGLSYKGNCARRLSGYGGPQLSVMQIMSVDQATCEANPTVFGLDAFAPAFDPDRQPAPPFIAANGVTNTL